MCSYVNLTFNFNVSAKTKEQSHEGLKTNDELRARCEKSAQIVYKQQCDSVGIIKLQKTAKEPRETSGFVMQ